MNTTFKEGAKVEAEYKGRWYGAILKKINGDGTALIHWEDGTK